MACAISCMISAVFVIGMIYFYNLTDKSTIVKHYKASLSSDLQKRYDKITKERTSISYQGYILGVILSLGIIFYNLKINEVKASIQNFLPSIKNPAVKIKLNEILSLICEVDKSAKVKNDDLVNLLQYYELTEELKRIH